MKTNLFRPALSFFAGIALLLAFAGRALAAPLTETTAVHTKPDAQSPIVTYLKAGAEPATAAGTLASTPAGWMAIELPGPFEGYVENKDLTKSLDVKPGANIRQQPKVDAGVLAVAVKDDKTTITGLHGKWTQVSLEKKLVGYIRLGGSAGYVPPIATAPATSTPPPSGGTFSPAPVSPNAYGVGGPGQAAPMVNLGDGGASSLPRQFVGKFVSTRRPLAPRRPYDWALNDDAGKRYAYLDVSKLLLTEQIEKYIDHGIVVYGVMKTTNEGKDLLIVVESLQLK
jgi:hypothetical protein